TNSDTLAAEVELTRASLLSRAGNYAAADAKLQHLAEAFARSGNSALELVAVGKLAASLRNQNRYEEAIRWLERAREKSKQLGKADSAARALGDLGSCYLRLGDLERARSQFNEAQAAFAKSGNGFDQQIFLGDLGEVSFEAADYAAATTQFRQALELSRGLKDVSWSAKWLSNLANTCVERKDWDCAEAYNREALELKRQLHDAGSQVYSIYNEGRIAVARGRLKEAEALFLEAEKARAEDPTVLLGVQRDLAELYRATGRPAKADAEFRAALAAIDQRDAKLVQPEHRFSSMASLIRFFHAYVEFLMDSHQPERALEIAESSRARVLNQGSVLAKGNQAGSAGAFRQLAARGKTTILEYWLGEQRSYLWIITPQKVSYRVLASTGELQPLIESYRAAILAQRNPLNSVAENGAKLSEALLPHLADGVKTSRFLIVPDGDLHSLNFETLPEAGKFWIEAATITIAPSLNYLLNRSAGRLAHQGLLMIGDPAASMQEYPRLEFAAQEMHSITAAMTGRESKFLSGADARPAAYAAAGPESFGFIHFAAHAAANARSPLDSSIILSGDARQCRLYARDVMSIPLAAELVTLSACRTAGAKTYAGEGMVGLAWAFLRAGSRSVVAGLWDVNDRSTAQLMTGLYGEIARGSTVADALRSAKLAMIGNGDPYRKPFYWAPFQVYVGAL
ncbi:MAG TPA: CHAT domain-containing protein, partial [Bryobacteraceae bacterium]|nr:CHAT domain-containing protein [Bryobacteraceae bacterium]